MGSASRRAMVSSATSSSRARQAQSPEITANNVVWGRSALMQDILEMVNAGLIPSIVVDNYLANFWKRIFTNITVHEDVALRTGGTLAIAVRKNSPQLSEALNTFMDKNGLGTSFGCARCARRFVPFGRT